MDFGTAIIGAISLAVWVVPVVLINRNRKKREKQLVQKLHDIALLQNCKITKYEFWDNSAIGLDEIANALFFFRQNKDKETLQYISLAEVQDCKVVNTDKTINNKEGSKVVEMLELSLSLTGNKPAILLEFYNINSDSATLSGELQLIEKWAKIVNNALR